jgi:tetratricopeptide (TPR) repeat protein
VRAQVYRDRGDIAKADLELRAVVRYYNQRDMDDKPITDPEELLVVGLADSEYARWHSTSDQFTFILNEVYGDAIKYDKDFWLAEYQAGMLLLEKYNRGEAQSAFDKALAINPQSAEALVGKAAIALERFDVKEAESFAERALKINPNLPERLVRADIHLIAGSTAEASRSWRRRGRSTARRVHARPRAACLYTRRKQDEFDALTKDVEKANPKAGLFYHELASALDGKRWFDDAEKFYKKAINLRSNLPWPRNGLGLLYMRMGREKDGRAIRDDAFEADPFNVRVSNMRKVLRHLDKYETIKTLHFEVRYDPRTDKRVATYMSDYLEEQYAELAELFRFKATGPILIEIFSNHEMFSGHVTALPDLHTIACTGKMFAMVSPNSKDMQALQLGTRSAMSWSTSST